MTHTATDARADTRLLTVLVARLVAAAWLLCACGDSGTNGTPERMMDSAVSPAIAATRVYASVSKTNEVLVIDESTRLVQRSIPVGRGPAILLATHDEKKIYSANWADNTVSAIDVATEQVTSIALSGRPYVIAMSPRGDRLYAGLSSSAIAVIDTATNSVLREWAADELPASLIVSPDGSTLYVATLGLGLTASGVGKLKALSAENGELTQPAIDVGAAPAWITITPDGRTVYTLNFLSDDISVVDTARWAVTTTVATGPGTQSIIGNVTRDGSALFVTNHGTGELLAIDTQTHAITLRVPLSGRPVGVNFTPDGRRVYTTDFGPESLATSSLAGLTYLLTGDYTASSPGQIRAFDSATGQPIGEPLSVGPGPTSLVILGR